MRRARAARAGAPAPAAPLAPALGALLVALASGLAGGLAQEAEPFLGSFRLEREGRVINVQQTAPDEEGGVFASRRGCVDDDTFSTVAYAPDPYRVETTIGDALARSSIVLREQPAGVQDEAVLTLAGGTLAFDEETFCATDVELSDAPDVEVVEGRTRATGSRLVYRNAEGLGVLTGDVTLERAADPAEPEGEPLMAEAERLEIDVDADATRLSGGVRVEQGDRVSTAATLELDEAAGLAVLRGEPGAPARSERGSDVLEGDVLRYDLETNEIVAVGGVSGTFEIDLE